MLPVLVPAPVPNLFVLLTFGTIGPVVPPHHVAVRLLLNCLTKLGLNALHSYPTHSECNALSASLVRQLCSTATWWGGTTGPMFPKDNSPSRSSTGAGTSTGSASTTHTRVHMHSKVFPRLQRTPIHPNTSPAATSALS